MNLLKKIEMPENGKGCVALFYESITFKTSPDPNTTFWEQTDRIDTRQNHCELFSKSELSSIGMNAKSFVLRFYSSSFAHGLKLYIRTPEQIEALAGMIEHTIGGGLKVKAHYANLFRSTKTSE